MRIRQKATTLTVVGVLVLILIVAVQPVLACEYGCTPGFWKQPQHFGYWDSTGYSPDMKVVDVFSEAASYVGAEDTLLEALDYEGGPGPAGAARILLRTAVASLLNVTYGDGAWDWGWWTPANLIENVNDRLAYGDRALMLSVVEQELDAYNNAGCPLEEQDW